MVLTGDKTETAVSIARTTGLLGPKTRIHRLDQDDDDAIFGAAPPGGAAKSSSTPSVS